MPNPDAYTFSFISLGAHCSFASAEMQILIDRLNSLHTMHYPISHSGGRRHRLLEEEDRWGATDRATGPAASG
jgi:hypothetical protein